MYRNELHTAIELARQASAIAMEIYGRDFEFHEKANDAGPVTEADLRINEFLTTELKKSFASDAVIGEESKKAAQGGPVHRRWIIDPIDGTKDFLKKNGEFSVMIGLAVDGRAELGVVAVPAEGKIYAGAPGYGAFVIDAQEHHTQLDRPATELSEATIVNSRSHPDPTIDTIQQIMGVPNAYRHGSIGCKLAHIAEGRADLYINLSGRCHWWDVCGPEAIVRQARGVVLTTSGEELRYEGTDTTVRVPFFAANAGLKDATILAVRAALQDK